VNRAPELVRSCANFRHGVVLPPQTVKRTFSDPANLFNVSVPQRSASAWSSAAGGLARNKVSAELAAIGEATERYAAHASPLPVCLRKELGGRAVLDLTEFSLFSPEQRRSADFPYANLYDGVLEYTTVFSLRDNSETYVPAALVGLREVGAGVTTSSGLAAGSSSAAALLRAAQELVERDALAISWLHGIRGRRVDLPERYTAQVGRLGGEAVLIDATPAYSPHPVALVAGYLPLRGRRRYSLGAACRETWTAAIEKAFLEWVQGVSFAGYYCALNQDAHFEGPEAVETFDDHAVYYTTRPGEWPDLPLFQGATVPAPIDGPAVGVFDALRQLVAAFTASGIRAYYRNLTTIDLRQVGIRVVRVLSPDLAPIWSHQRWPFLGGTVPDIARRYPWAEPSELLYPNPYPHPLG
jgi:ribosomal protein S12 methylthiotransferase accessory factor